MSSLFAKEVTLGRSFNYSNDSVIQNIKWARPVILATWEAELILYGQPRQIVCETPPPSPK
jgi:hypothetical protein